MKQYLLDRIKIIGMFLLFACMILCVEWVYSEKMSVCLYALALCLFIFICIGTYDFAKYIKRRNLLRDINTQISTLPQIERMPEPKDCMETLYQDIFFGVDKSRGEAFLRESRHEEECRDYYTIWVHQIKTPIFALRLLLKNEEDQTRKMMLEQELFKIEQYAEMVLHFVRIDSMSADFVFREYNLVELVKNALKKFASVFSYKKLALDLKFPTEAAKAAAAVGITDEKWTSLVIEQLLSNAVKYTKQGKITIEVALLEKENCWCLKIEDTGIGIAPEDLPRIFERGFTGFNGRQDKKSTGIGLYLCKRTTDRLGQKLDVQSELSKGTTVRLLIPCAPK